MTILANSAGLTITGVEPDIASVVIGGVTYTINDYDGTLASIGPNITVSNLNVFAGLSITVNATLGTITYASQNTEVSISGSVDIAATLGTITYVSQNASVNLAGSIDINATLGVISYNSNSAIITLGANQIIGSVTVAFASDIYQTDFKQNSITSIFKG